jgi:antitoxin component of MazEF toxin-antitoxin module
MPILLTPGASMRLLRNVSRTIGKNEYSKWIIIIPPSQVEQLGWREGEELESCIKDKLLLIKPSVKKKESPHKMSYLEFREKIAQVLKTQPNGLSWTEIRERLQLSQKVPNNLWVATMEREIGLQRRSDSRTAKIIWKLGPKDEAPEKEEEARE